MLRNQKLVSALDCGKLWTVITEEMQKNFLGVEKRF